MTSPKRSGMVGARGWGCVDGYPGTAAGKAGRQLATNRVAALPLIHHELDSDDSVASAQLPLAGPSTGSVVQGPSRPIHVNVGCVAGDVLELELQSSDTIFSIMELIA